MYILLICYKSINAYDFIHLYIFSLVLKSAYFTGLWGYTPKFYAILFRYSFDFMHNEHKKCKTSTKIHDIHYPSTRVVLIFPKIETFIHNIFFLEKQIFRF